MNIGEENTYFPSNYEGPRKPPKGVYILWILCLIYVISPVDLVPGPVDDAIISFVTWGITACMKR